MRWIRTCLLSAAASSLGLAAASAQTGVTLSRPQPLGAPSDPSVPVFVPYRPVVRAQMDERYLPNGAGEGKVQRAFQTPEPPMLKPQGESSSPAGSGESSSPAASEKKPFIAPQPRSVYWQRNPWTGAKEGIVLDEGTVVIAESDPASLFSGLTPVHRLYGSAEYLSWWTKGYQVPLLITTAPATDPEATRGAVGFGGTTPVFGDSRIANGQRNGARFALGWFVNPCGTCAIEADYFFLARRSDTFTTDSTQFPVLARPFFLVNTGTQSRELTATPGLLPGDVARLNGSISVGSFSDFQGADLIGRWLCRQDCNYKVGVLAGFRYLDLNEGLAIGENVTSLRTIPGTTVFNAGNNILVSDAFTTHNQFYGGQLGIDGEWRRGRWSLTGRLQVGLGATHETVNIVGSQIVTTPAGQRTVFNGGLLALPSNSGTMSQDRFAVVPQIGLKVGYHVTENIKLYAGYDFLYWSNVLRPGDQIDLALNATQIPNAGVIPPSTVVRPVVPFRTSDFWAQGFSVGLEVRY